jgi:hypothetical protein
MKGSPITKNKIILWGIRREEQAGTVNRNRVPLTQSRAHQLCERATKIARDAVGLSFALVECRDLALAAVSFPAPVPHLLQFLFSI